MSAMYATSGSGLSVPPMIKAVVAWSWTAVVIVHEIATTTAPSSARKPTHSVQ
jgi:hypothetical protein